MPCACNPAAGAARSSPQPLICWNGCRWWPWIWGAEAVVDPGEVVLDRVAKCEIEIARLQALTAADLLDFGDVRTAEAVVNVAETYSARHRT